MFIYWSSFTNILQEVIFWLDIVLSIFLHSVDDNFRDFRNNACFLLASSFFQLGDSLGIISLYSFLYVTL